MEINVALPRIRSDRPYSVDEDIAIVHAAEAAGLHAVSVNDHPFPVVSTERPGHQAPDPFVALAFLAGATTTLGLHFSLLVAPYRNPFLAARALATLSQMSKGRTVATLGTGYLREEFDALGSSYEDRLTDEQESVRAMRLAWTGEPVHAKGNGWAAVGNSMYPRPWEDKDVPLWRGGNTMKALRHVAANYDGWSPTGSSPDVAQQINSAPMTLETLGPKAARLLDLWEENDRAGKPDICWSDGDLSWLISEDAIASRLGALSRMGVTWLKVKLSGRTTHEKTDSLHRLGSALASADVLDEPPAQPAPTADLPAKEAATMPR